MTASDTPLRVALVSQCNLIVPGFQQLCTELRLSLVVLQDAGELAMLLRSGEVFTVVVTDPERTAGVLHHPQLHTLPVVVITSGLVQSVDLARNPRVTGVLRLPMVRSMVVDMIYAVLEHKRYFSPVPVSALQSRLSRRQQEVYRLQMQGHTDDDIAEQLSLDYDTVIRYDRNIRARLRVLEQCGDRV